MEYISYMETKAIFRRNISFVKYVIKYIMYL